jgi:sigma-B regulation protein RsbU (phosphoserine phosphatase)
VLLGVEPGATYRSGSRTFAPGDVLLLYSDGCTDVLNDADEEFGRLRLEALVRRVAHLPCNSLLESNATAVETFVGGVLPDDLTILVAKFLPEPDLSESSV